MTKPEDLVTNCKISWCPGCGNFGIWGAFKTAAVQAGWNSSNSVMVAGIGCHGQLLDFVKNKSTQLFFMFSLIIFL